jgi:hypothetical protein
MTKIKKPATVLGAIDAISNISHMSAHHTQLFAANLPLIDEEQHSGKHAEKF